MKKRWLSILLVLCMMLGLVAGCGKTEKDDKKTSSNGDITLTVGIPQNGVVTDYDENAFTKYVEENLGFDIEIVLLTTDTDDFEQQLTLMSVGNEELPDVILGYIGMAKGTVYNFGNNGILQDLTDYIEEYAPNFNKHVDAMPKDLQKALKNKMADPESGKIYGMPYFVDFLTIDDMKPCTININQDWLHKVGMSAPTTPDELYQVLKAFKEKDPNGNGKADEIPILGQGIISYIINAFTYFEAGTPYAVENDKVYSVVTKDTYRQALAFCNKLVKEGLFSELNFTATSQSEYMSLISPADNVAKVGIWCGHPELITTTSNTILNQYTALNALTDATGEGGYMPLGTNQFYFSGLVTKDCKHPEAAMQFIDLLYADESVTRARWGEKDVDWTTGTGTNINGNEATIKIVNTNITDDNKSWITTLPSIITESNYLRILDFTEDVFGQRCRLEMESGTLIKSAKIKEQTLLDIVYNEKEREAMATVSGDVVGYMNEMQTKFAMGDVNVNDDSKWNAYVAELERLGLNDLIEVAQDAYNRTYKK